MSRRPDAPASWAAIVCRRLESVEHEFSDSCSSCSTSADDESELIVLRCSSETGFDALPGSFAMGCLHLCNCRPFGVSKSPCRALYQAPSSTEQELCIQLAVHPNVIGANHPGDKSGLLLVIFTSQTCKLKRAPF